MSVTDEIFQVLVAVGIKKLLIPWEENTEDQRDYCLCYAAEGTDPFTIPLEVF
jgi:hypothetical protein